MIFTSRLRQQWKTRKLQNELLTGEGQRAEGAPQGDDIQQGDGVAVHERGGVAPVLWADVDASIWDKAFKGEL